MLNSMEEDLKEFKLLKSGLKIVAFAFLLLVIQLSLYYLLDPELTFTIDESDVYLLPSMMALAPISALLEELGLRAFPHFIVIGLIRG